MDYECGGQRKTKNDKKAKRRFRVFKHGGHLRTSEVKDK